MFTKHLIPPDAVCLAILLCTFSTNAANPTNTTGHAFFEKKIRPLLAEHCYRCHSPAKKIKSGLQLDSRAGLRKGGDHGQALVPGDPDNSLLIHAVGYDDPDLQMPPKQKLPDQAIADLKQWIAMGAPDPRDGPIKTLQQKPATQQTAAKLWSFQPITNPKPPAVQNAAWPKSDIDRFILAKLESQKLTPTTDAPDELLCRRLYLTLIGLPPTPDQTRHFIAAAQKDREAATTQLVDQLLASDRFGEKWGRHWLDIARYSDTNIGSPHPPWTNAWLYRNYVIQRFNEDIPFDRFILEQIAGDMLPHKSDTQRADQLVATGFLALATRDLNERDIQMVQLDGFDDTLETIGKGLLGLSIGCARCHDHKFDPIPTQDYYAMAGILRSSWQTGIGYKREPFNGDFVLKPHDTEPNIKLPGSNLPATVVTEYPPDQRHKEIGDMPIYLGGSYRDLGPVAPRGFIRALPVNNIDPIPNGESGRIQFAQWLTSQQNPLTPRVMANRVWYWLFGTGLVSTLDNFGVSGAAPSHPKLLDHLATQLRDTHHWRLKPLIRQIVLSRTWQLSTTHPNTPADPQNKLYARMNRRRLEAEQLHDSLLALSNRLNLSQPQNTLPEYERSNVFNASVVPIDEEIRRHRAVYLPVFRKDTPNDLDLLTTFNFPDAKSMLGQRDANTVPAQALYLWNGPATHAAANTIADALTANNTLNDKQRVKHIILALYGRTATPQDHKQLLNMHNDFETLYAQQPSITDPAASAWRRVVHTLLISNEFIFIS